jgi:thiosulfate/3-mercaptopyruvate sulfurtransferase
MKRKLELSLVSLLVLAGTVEVLADSRDVRDPRGAPAKAAVLPLVVDGKWLAANLSSPELVLLHVGDAELYRKQHIRGARLISFADAAVEGKPGESLVLELPAPETLRAGLEKLGISDGSRIVVIFSGDWTSAATRVLFTLHAAGLGARSTMLDGGMTAWTKAGHPTTAEVPAPRQGKLSPLKMQPVIVDAKRVLTSLGKKGVAIVDARDREFYDGAKIGGMHGPAHKKGHIKGAVSLPYHRLFDEQLALRSPQALRALFAEAGVREGDAVIAYCHIGQQATAVWLAAKQLGHQVLLYDGAFEDWSLFHPAYPVEAPAKRDAKPAKRAPSSSSAPEQKS